MKIDPEPPATWVSEWSGLKDAPNADCAKCGPTKMLFEGFI